jgi:hypothetical protein
MATISTKGLKIRMEDNGNTRTSIVITAISAASPAVVTAGAPPADGTIIFVPSTIGLDSIGGKSFYSANANAGDFELIGSDTSAGVTELTIVPLQGVARDTMTTAICASAITVDNNVAGTISTATFCDPDASITSTVTELGNVTLSVFHDLTDAGFNLLRAAAEADEGNTRMMLVEFPNNGGTLITSGVISGFGLADVPIDGAAAWEGTYALKTKPYLRLKA